MMVLTKHQGFSPWGLGQEDFLKIFRIELKPLDIFEIRPSNDQSYKVW